MSATRDRSQKFAFVYSNLYQIYKSDRKGWSNDGPVVIQHQSKDYDKRGLSSGVIKAQDAAQTLRGPAGHQLMQNIANRVQPSIQPYAAPKFEANRIPEAAKLFTRSAKLSQSPVLQVESLKANLADLESLQSRLKFMLKEIEELTKKS